jgi:hypothetical protein
VPTLDANSRPCDRQVDSEADLQSLALAAQRSIDRALGIMHEAISYVDAKLGPRRREE